MTVMLLACFETLSRCIDKSDAAVSRENDGEDVSERRLCSNALVEVDIALSRLWGSAKTLVRQPGTDMAERIQL
jgi:hypothetical protein